MSGIRVIGGRARGRRLELVPGDSTRPISDRVKENLFNILGPEIVRSQFLDLFAGTGSVGIEALSRGAASAVFLDLNRQAVQTIHKNLKATGFETQARVIQRDAFAFLDGKADTAFDYVFIAPPQYRDLWGRALQAVDRRPDWLAADGWVVVQIDPKERVEAELENLVLFDERKYGNTLLLFFEIE